MMRPDIMHDIIPNGDTAPCAHSPPAHCCVDRVHQRYHLVHVNESPKQPHANCRSHDNYKRQRLALFLRAPRSLLDKEVKGDKGSNDSQDQPAAGASEESRCHEAERHGALLVELEESNSASYTKPNGR